MEVSSVENFQWHKKVFCAALVHLIINHNMIDYHLLCDLTYREQGSRGWYTWNKVICRGTLRRLTVARNVRLIWLTITDFQLHRHQFNFTLSIKHTRYGLRNLSNTNKMFINVIYNFKQKFAVQSNYQILGTAKFLVTVR